MSAVKDMIARLDAAKLQEAQERAERARAAEEAARAAAASEQERIRREKASEVNDRFVRTTHSHPVQEEEEARKLKAIEEEKLKWKVNEDECALDVLERKKKFLESHRKPGAYARAFPRHQNRLLRVPHFNTHNQHSGEEARGKNQRCGVCVL
jgi:hypothetical protein